MHDNERKVLTELKDDVLKAKKQPSLWKDILNLFIKILIILFSFFLLFTFMFGIFRNEDASMAPALKAGDVVMFYRLDKEYVASDAIVLEYEGEKQVRRVVAVGGDSVDITEDGLIVNGARVQESEIFSETVRYEEGINFPLTVEEDQVFTLGDARQNAIDSRIYGVVNSKDTLGKVMTIVRRRGI